MQEPIINVGILTDNQIKVELHGEFAANFSEKLFNGPITARIENDKMYLDVNGKKIETSSEVVFSPTDNTLDTFIIKDVIIGIQFHWQKKEKQSFVGKLKLIKDGDKIIAVNIVPIEQYLTSVISSEMSAHSSLELLKAHSVISRSWLIAQLEKTKKIKETGEKYISLHQTEEELIKWYDREEHNLYDVCADDHCQRYQGVTKVYSENAKNAVTSTRGLLLMHGNEVCDARFSKSCGGISENFENVWEPIKYPYLTAIVDNKFEPENFNLDLTIEENAVKWIKGSPPAFCNTVDTKVLAQVLVEFDQKTTDFYRWVQKYSQTEVADLINAKSGFDFGEILDLIPIERGPSGRILKLKIVGTKKTLTIGKELQIRKVLSTSHLKSSAFVVEKNNVNANGVPQEFSLIGAGWGHGVGLCQIGAAVMGELGYKFDEILYHYFKEIDLKKMYE